MCRCLLRSIIFSNINKYLHKQSFVAFKKSIFQTYIFTTMKKIILPGLAVFMLFALSPACKKNKNGGGCGESEIKVTTTPAVGTVDLPYPGTSIPLTVNITNGIPSSGITIQVTARTETNSTPFFTETRDGLSSNSFTITNTPPGVTCISEITVTSKSCNTNKWSGSYRFSGK